MEILEFLGLRNAISIFQHLTVVVERSWLELLREILLERLVPRAFFFTAAEKHN